MSEAAKHLVAAYKLGKESGGSINWENIDHAHKLAVEEVGDTWTYEKLREIETKEDQEKIEARKKGRKIVDQLKKDIPTYGDRYIWATSADLGDSTFFDHIRNYHPTIHDLLPGSFEG